MKDLTNSERLQRIAEILELVDQRCMAADGPVSQTKEEIDGKELREIYELASKRKVRRMGREYPYNATNRGVRQCAK